MKIVNSYVFLLREKSKMTEDEDGNLFLDLSKNVHTLLKKSFDIIEDDVTFDDLESPTPEIEQRFQKMIKGIKTGVFTVRNKCINASYKISTVDTTEYLDIEVEGSNKNSLISLMQKFHNKIVGNKSMFAKDFIVITSYDSISDYYCNKIYSLLSKFERTLRKLLLIVYTSQFKKAYFEETTSEEIKSHAKKIIKNKNDDIRLQNYLYSLDFGMMRNLLFEKRWTSYDEKNLDKYLKKNKDLTTLSDDELRKKINSIRPSSDWEKLFCNKGFDDDFEVMIARIGELRNLVAHNKIFTKEQYFELKELLEGNINVLEQAILLTEEEDFKKLNEEKHEETLERIREIVSKSLTAIADMIKEVTSRITFSDLLSNFNDNIKEGENNE